MNSPNIFNLYEDRYLRNFVPRDYQNSQNFAPFRPSHEDCFNYDKINYLNPYNNPYYNQNYLPPIQQTVIERPIKYFFQKPLYLSEDKMSFEKKEQILKIKNHNKIIENIISKARWGKPMRMQDILCNRDNDRNSKLRIYKPEDVIILKNEIRQKKEKETERKQLQKELKIGKKAKKEKLRLGNRKYWNILGKFRYILKFYKILKDFTRSSIQFKRNKNSISDSFKIDTLILTNFIRNSIKSIEDLVANSFNQPLVIDLNNYSKTEDTIFRIKTFIHQIFYDLSKSFTKESLPKNIKEILLKYISNGAQLPDDFLTTFEFNRLEFDINMKLTNMTIDKQAMMICFILLYRILLEEIMTNYKNYFLKLSKVDMRTKILKSSDDDIRRRIVGITNIIQENTGEHIGFNFSFACHVLNAIFKNVFTNSPKIYREQFKEAHMYKEYVSNGAKNRSDISDRIHNDLIEFAQKFPKIENADEFVKQHIKWINMHQITVLSLCINLVETILN